MEKTNKNILVVDEEPDIVDSMLHFFQRRFQNCFSAKDGQEALDICSNQKIDILLTDIMIPKVNGSELIKRIRDEHPYIYPIALINGPATEMELQGVMNMGIPVFHKPVDLYTLEDHINTHAV